MEVNQLYIHKNFNNKNDKHISKWIIYCIILLFALFCVVPFVLVVIISLTPQDLIKENGYRFFPSRLTLDAYKYIFRFPKMILNGYKNSFFITIVGTTLNVFLTLLIAYPLSRPNFRYRRAISFYVFFTMMFSGGLVPYYIMTKQILNLGDNIWVLILPLLVVPNNVFLLRIFIQGGVPEAIYESAKLDGAGEYTILFKLIVPLIKPGIATVTMFIMLMYWNDIITAKLFISDQDLFPLQLLLDNYSEYIKYLSVNSVGAGIISPVNIPSDSILFAMCVIATGPMLFVFLFFQKYFVSGLTMGAVKN